MTNKGWVELQVQSLVKANWNYKTDSEEVKEKLRENIKRNGLIENLIVRELDTGFFEVVNGNHRFDVIKELGSESVMCFNLGVVSQAQAMRIAIETNETKFAPDNLKLAESLKEIGLEFSLDDLEKTMPFSKEELENFDKLLNFDFDSMKNEPENTGSNQDDDWKTITLRLPEGVADQFLNQIDRFKQALHPEEKDLSVVSPVMAIEAMTQHLAQIQDIELI